jgi:hypothetical protein
LKKWCQSNSAIRYGFAENQFSFDLSELLTRYLFGLPTYASTLPRAVYGSPGGDIAHPTFATFVIENRSTGLSQGSLLSREENLPPHLYAHPLDKMDLTSEIIVPICPNYGALSP